ncbi:MAG: hypothetical protein ACE3JK_05590 [Sporolactobacillus sp.]
MIYRYLLENFPIKLPRSEHTRYNQKGERCATLILKELKGRIDPKRKVDIKNLMVVYWMPIIG